MTDRHSQGVREALARFALELDGINDRFAEHAHQRSDALSARTPVPPATEISIDDWDGLLSAVKCRLRQAVDQTITGQLNGAAVPFRTMVLECVDALDHLQAALHDGRVRQSPIAGPEGRPDESTADAPDPAVRARADLVDLADGSALPSAAPAAVVETHPRTTPV